MQCRLVKTNSNSIEVHKIKEKSLSFTHPSPSNKSYSSALPPPPPGEAVILTTATVGLATGIYLRTSELVSGEAPPLPCHPVSGLCFLIVQISLEKDQRESPLLAVTRESARKGAKLVCPALLSPLTVLRAEGYMKP